jgi:hypothetical protein
MGAVPLVLLEREWRAVDALDRFKHLLYRLFTVIPARIVVEQDVLDVREEGVVQEALVLLAADVAPRALAPAA